MRGGCRFASSTRRESLPAPRMQTRAVPHVCLVPRARMIAASQRAFARLSRSATLSMLRTCGTPEQSLVNIVLDLKELGVRHVSPAWATRAAFRALTARFVLFL